MDLFLPRSVRGGPFLIHAASSGRTVRNADQIELRIRRNLRKTIEGQITHSKSESPVAISTGGISAFQSDYGFTSHQQHTAAVLRLTNRNFRRAVREPLTAAATCALKGDGGFGERAQDRANLHMGPLATARCEHSLVELRGNGVMACNARPLDLLKLSAAHWPQTPSHWPLQRLRRVSRPSPVAECLAALLAPWPPVGRPW
jgi:hypothetical protein